MSRILCFSDLHAHPFKPYSTILENGLNSRLNDAVECINQIKDYCLENEDIDLILFAGDLFHERRHVVTEAFNAVYDALLRLYLETQIPIAMIPGNHDEPKRTSTPNALHSLQPFATVFNSSGWFEVKGRSRIYNIFALPYKDDQDLYHGYFDYENGSGRFTVPSLLLGHVGFDGAKAGADFVYRNPQEPSTDDIPFSAFDACFFGHFHIHQPLSENAWYIGAPNQHNWGDKGQIRGFVTFNTDTKELLKIPLKAPKFVEFSSDYSKIQKSQTEGNFVRLVTNKEFSLDEREDLRVKWEAKYLEIVKPELDVDEAHEKRLEMDPSSSFEDMIYDYIHSNYVELKGMDEDRLIEIGRNLIHEASQN